MLMLMMKLLSSSEGRCWSSMTKDESSMNDAIVSAF